MKREKTIFILVNQIWQSTASLGSLLILINVIPDDLVDNVFPC